MLPNHMDYGIIKLKKVAREFRMSSKDLNRKERRPPLTSSKTMKTLPSKPASERLRTCSSTPTSPELFPKYRAGKEAKPRKGTLVIEVSDTGCGIADSEKEKLFQPFSQANKSVQSKFGGTGLGLWLCHKLITAMNGSITCSSELGKGTTFKVALELNYKSRNDDLNV